MSTKKEKCCGCPEEQDICRGECMCHHSQSESIELEDFLDDEGMLCESYDESGRQEQDGITEKQLEKLKEFFSQAITTAVAKREQEILEEAKKKISSKQLLIKIHNNSEAYINVYLS